MDFDFNNYDNIIGDYIPVDLEKYRPNYGKYYPEYSIYGYDMLYINQNYGFQNQYGYKPIYNFSNLAPIQNNLNLVNQNKTLNNSEPIDPNKSTEVKKTPDEPPDEGPLYYILLLVKLS
jgi:hypothetical protein